MFFFFFKVKYRGQFKIMIEYQKGSESNQEGLFEIEWAEKDCIGGKDKKEQL